MGKVRILYIEDNSDSMTLVKRVLRSRAMRLSRLKPVEKDWLKPLIINRTLYLPTLICRILTGTKLPTP